MACSKNQFMRAESNGFASVASPYDAVSIAVDARIDQQLEHEPWQLGVAKRDRCCGGHVRSCALATVGDTVAVAADLVAVLQHPKGG